MANLYVKDAGTWVDFGAAGTTPTSVNYTVDGFLTIPSGITRATVVIGGGRGSGGNDDSNGGGTNGGNGGVISVTFDVTAGELYYIQYINGGAGSRPYPRVNGKYTGGGGSTMAFGPWTGSTLSPSGVWVIAGGGGGGGGGPGSNQFQNAGWFGGGDSGGGPTPGTQSSGFSQYLGGGASPSLGGCGCGGSGWWGGGGFQGGASGSGGSGGSSYNGVPSGRNPVLNQNTQGTNSNNPYCNVTLA